MASVHKYKQPGSFLVLLCPSVTLLLVLVPSRRQKQPQLSSLGMEYKPGLGQVPSAELVGEKK